MYFMPLLRSTLAFWYCPGCAERSASSRSRTYAVVPRVYRRVGGQRRRRQ